MQFTDAMHLLVIGLAQGSGYALVALGFVFIYRATEIVNFAHGELMMLGAFAVLTFAELWGLGFWLGAAMGILSLGVFGYALDALVMRRVIGESQSSIFILTVALGVMLKALAGMIWGYTPLVLNVPFQGTVDIGGMVIATNRIAVIIGTVLICIALYLFLGRTRLGLAMQAASQNQLAAYYSRVPVKRLISVIWAIGAMVAATAGVLMAPVTQVSPEITAIGIKALAGAVVGGFGSIPGALLGCLLIGVAEPFLDYTYPPLQGVYAYAIMLVVLLVRPEGLIPQTFRKKV
ncbi:amino acid/amide ABC transporter membrane protein 1, HAAT family [Gemmobacter megaterium]|uniref:Amino acid/amide ABC transporter membrane protein 1, HAAT family n=1 Tax=Gemmobacter megaterium TaxID=1086013 RepID=A0A1N7MZX8_9RHOB|nr:branched-chain amino acid ABC transporter permease [Gemmobacter megaterium]GGE12123.1 branched-chain amino acid ABC transporter permease [Gemmobacter megaterium]SIS91650.1 amino acid/amide ABC transporter membrane protein 1, HAAT family [Gemmobacter megaterium]